MDRKESYTVSVAGSVESRFAVLSYVAEWGTVEYAGASLASPDEDVYGVESRALCDFRSLVKRCGCSVSFFMRYEG